jgi:putative hemolysin
VTPHIVDVLIEERAAGLMRRPVLWRAVQRYLYPLLGYDDAIRMVNELRNARGREVFDWLSDRLAMRIEHSGLAHIPPEGRAVIMANHPAGIADGIAVYDVLKNVRDDIIFLANRDAIRAIPGLDDMIIPVEWMEQRRDHSRNRETVKALLQAFRDERLIVIFPSGRLARPTVRGLVERPWMSSGMNMAQRYGCPVIPMHVSGLNSVLFYLLWFVNTELKDMTLFRELLNKGGAHYRITTGEAFTPVGDPEALTLALREFVTKAMPRGERRFNPHTDIAPVPQTVRSPI